jgi:hypothetical protein
MRAQWELSVSGTPFPWQALALSSADELSDLAVRVASAPEHDQPLTDLDWLGGIFDRVLLGQQPSRARRRLRGPHRSSDADALSMLRRPIQLQIGRSGARQPALRATPAWPAALSNVGLRQIFQLVRAIHQLRDFGALSVRRMLAAEGIGKRPGAAKISAENCRLGRPAQPSLPFNA